MKRQEKIQVLLELIHCSYQMDYWVYTPEGECVQSTSDAVHLLDVLFKESGCMAYLQQSLENVPLILAAKRDLRWIGVKEEQNGTLSAYHILGPFLISRYSKDITETDSNLKNRNTTQIWIEKLDDILASLSVVPIENYTQYAVMLYKLVNDESVAITDIIYQTPPVTMFLPDAAKKKDQPKIKDRMHIVRIEQTLLQAVREGDENAAATAMLQIKNEEIRVREYTGDYLLDLKIASTTFIAICTRAAIEGGLDPSIAYPIGDSYIRKIYKSYAKEYIKELLESMYQNFISQVHARRVNPDYSKVIQSCCDYVRLHYTEPLSIDILANRLGYAKYYLSALFKKETGSSVSEYIKKVRIERAEMLLYATDLNIKDIWEEAGFSSGTVFGKAFREVTGMTPREFRNRNIRP